MASSALQLIISMSGLPVDFIGSNNKTIQNASALPAWRYLDLTTSEVSYTITATNTRILMAGQLGNAVVYYHSFETGFTATNGTPHHVTEPSVITIPAGGDIIYFRLPASTCTIFIAQF